MSAVKRLAALGCVSLFATSVAACGSGGSVTGSSNAAITIGAYRAYASLDPANAYDYASWNIFYNIYQTLVSYAPGASTPTPDAAKSCAFTDSTLTTYTCTLRSGLKFTNGDTLDADAVKYSFQRMMRLNAADGSSGNGPGPLVGGIASISTSGSTGITFHLKAPDANFPGEIAGGAGAIVDPKVFPDDKPYTGTQPVGSGVYKVDSAVQKTVDGSTQGVSVSLSLNSHYQGAASTPQNSHVDVKYFDSPDALYAALKAGKVDVADNDLTPQQIADLQADQQAGTGIQVVSGVGTGIRVLGFDVRDQPFDQPLVRRAVAELINQQDIALGPQKGQADPLYSIVPNGIGGHNTAFGDDYSSHSVSQAREWLQEAGVSTPVSFTLTYAKDSPAGDAEAQLIKQQLEKGGLFKVGLNPVANVSVLTGAQGTRGDKDPVFLGSWYPDYPDAADYVEPLVDAYNTHYSNDDVDKTLLPATNRMADRADAEADFGKIQDAMAADAAFVPLWQAKQYMATQSTVVGVSLTMDAADILRFWMIGKGA